MRCLSTRASLGLYILFVYLNLPSGFYTAGRGGREDLKAMAKPG